MPMFVDTSPPGACIFCRLIAGDIPAARVYEDAQTIAFMDLGQVTPGHVLVASRRHAASLYELSPQEAGAVMATQKAALQETLMAEQFPDAEPLLLPDFPQCIANLKNGECAAVMIDEISAEQYMQTVEGLAIGKVPVEIDPEEGGNAVAVMKGNTDLLDWVNERIAAYEAEGLLEQWFQEAQEKAASMGIE